MIANSAVLVRTPQILDLDGYVHLLGAVEHALRMGCTELEVDLSNTERAYPDGVLPLIATLMRLRWSHKLEVGVVLPKTDYLRAVFEGVGWAHYLSSPRPEFRGLPKYTRQFTPATPFGTTSELDAVRKSIMQIVLSQGRLASWLPEAIEWSLWEVMENVLNHSGVGMGWVQVSTFAKTRHVNMVVVDSGIGIRESLSERYVDLSDYSALKRAVEEGGTRDPLRNAGYGLTGCARITLSNRGQMTVYSGGYRLVVQPGPPKQPDLFRYVRQEAHHYGTLVELELRMDRPVDPARAFPQRPMPLIELLPGSGREYVFDVAAEANSLGTREAGREFRNKILNLGQGDPEARIVLDFAGVGMLSSSFADELVARLAADLGKRDFFRGYELRNMNASVETIVYTVLWDRLG